MSKITVDTVEPATGTSLTLGASGDTITVPAGATLTNSGTFTNSGTASGFGLFSAYAILREEQSSGTNGTTVSGTGSWITQVINVEVDPSSIVSVSSNQFTLGAGSYLITWFTALYAVNTGQSRLYDVTGSAVCTNGYGSSETDGTASRSRISTGHVRVTPSGSNVYRIECNASSNSGPTAYWGGAAGRGGTEVYREIIIYKES
ncbi:MAG: hypothetical protein GY893_10595 [bacterium]|nr:hypothetical protein [bacterium]